MKLALAQTHAKKIAEWLQPHCERIEIAGSIRRERPECADVDLVCIPKITEERDMLGEVIHRRNHIHHQLVLHALDDKCRIVSGGEREGKQMIVELKSCQLDLWFADTENFGTRLLCRTGSKEHNTLLALRAQDLGGSWNPYEGLTLKGELLPAGIESDIYHALKMPFIKPKNREGEFVAALIHSLAVHSPAR